MELTRDFPTLFSLVELLGLVGRETDDDVTLDRAERQDGRRARLRREGSDRHRERRRRRRVAVVSELAVIQVALEDDEVGIGEVEEEIRS